MIQKLLYIFLISMVPIVELRGAIPYAAIGEPRVEFWLAALVAIAGNFIPAPLVMFFLDKIMKLFGRTKVIGPVLNKFMERAENKAKKIGKYELLGLLALVAIPLPGTGAWTGAAVATVLKLPKKSSLLMIFLGLIVSAAIMTVLSYVVPGFLF